MSRLWQKMTLILVARLCPKGIVTLALDDTLFHHSGRKIDGAGYWRDAVRSTKKKVVTAWGLNLVVLTLQIQPPWGGEPLGLPINMNGTEGPRCQSTRQFAKNLSARLPLPILLWDERLSTAAVTRTLLEADMSRKRRAEVVDKMAAAYLLQGVLDALGRLEKSGPG